MSQIQVPKGWDVINLGDHEYFERIGGKTPLKSESKYWENGKIFWLSGEDIDDNGVNLLRETKQKITKNAIEDKAATLVPRGSIVLSCTATIGKVGITENEMATNQQFNSFVIKKGFTDKFLAYYFLASKGKLLKLAKTTTFPHITIPKLLTFVIPKPEIELQKKIVQKLDYVFEQLEEKKNKILELQNLENIEKISKIYHKQRLAKIFHGQLTENWRKYNKNTEYASDLIKKILKESKKKNITTLPNKLPKLPTSWSWISLGDIFDIKPGGTPSRSEAKYWNGDINWVSSGEVANCEIKQTKERITKLGMENSSAKIRPSGTILLAMIGQGKTRGQVAILRIDAATNQNVASIQTGKTGVIPEYVFNWLLHRYEETRILGWGGRQKAMNTQHVREILIPLAPIEEQKQIIDVILNEKKQLNEINEQISLVKKTKEKTAKNIDNISRGILEKAFLGHLVS